MTLTTKVRFLAPIDPRLVWAKVAELVNAPDDYRWCHRGANDDVIHAPNPSIWAEPEQGADAWARLYYGHEGSLLIEDDPPSHIPEALWPPAYVDLMLDTVRDDDGACVMLHHRIGRAIQQWSPVAVALWFDGSGLWAAQR